MHGMLVAVGTMIVAMIVVHIIFRVIKFTIGVFLFGVCIVAILYVLHQYMGIDILGPAGAQP